MDRSKDMWRPLVRNLRFTLGCTQAQLAEKLGIDQAAVSRWERGTQLPCAKMQVRIRDLLHKSESSIPRAFLEEAPVIAIMYDMNTFGLCVAASQPLAEAYALNAKNFRYRSMLDIWTPSIKSAMRTLVESHEWKSNEMAFAKSKVRRRDNAWLKFTYTAVSSSGLCFANATTIDKPRHLRDNDFELEIFAKDSIPD